MRDRGNNINDSGAHIAEPDNSSVDVEQPADSIQGQTFASLFEESGMKGFDLKEKERFMEKEKSGRINYPVEPQESVDLHNLTKNTAERMLRRELISARQRGLVFVLVITGKGNNSADGKAVLKPMAVKLFNELIQDNVIKDFKRAEPRHGGFGAYYVYVK